MYDTDNAETILIRTNGFGYGNGYEEARLYRTEDNKFFLCRVDDSDWTERFFDMSEETARAWLENSDYLLNWRQGQDGWVYAG